MRRLREEGVGRAEVRAQALEHALKGPLRSAREAMVLAAVRATGLVNTHFDQVRDKRQVLREALLHGKKLVTHPITDVHNATAALNIALHLSRTPCPLDEESWKSLEHLAHHHHHVWGVEMRGLRLRFEFAAGAVDPRVGGLLHVVPLNSRSTPPFSPLGCGRPRSAPDLAVATSFHASATHPGGSVFVLGGWAHTKNLATIQVLFPGQQRWDILPASLPIPCQRCGACFVGSVLVVVGGQWRGRVPIAAAHALDLRSHTWAELPSLPVPTRGCAVVAMGTRVFVFGGSERKPLNRTWVLDLGQGTGWEPLADLSTPRFQFAGTGGDGWLYACGGKLENNHLASCEMLDTRTPKATWVKMEPMPTTLAECSGCYSGGNVFVVGPSDRAVVYVCAQKAWHFLPSLCTGRRAFSVTCVQKRLLVLGGFMSRELDSVEEYDFDRAVPPNAPNPKATAPRDLRTRLRIWR